MANPERAFRTRLPKELALAGRDLLSPHQHNAAIAAFPGPHRPIGDNADGRLSTAIERAVRHASAPAILSPETCPGSKMQSAAGGSRATGSTRSRASV